MNYYEMNTTIEHQKMISVIALVLAAKVEDVDCYIPSLKDLYDFFDHNNFMNSPGRNDDKLSATALAIAFKKFAQW